MNKQKLTVDYNKQFDTSSNKAKIMDKQELIDRLEKAIKEHSPPLLEPEEVEYLKGLLEQEQEEPNPYILKGDELDRAVKNRISGINP